MRPAASLYALAIVRGVLAVSSTLFAANDTGTTLLTFTDAENKASLTVGSTVLGAAGSRLLVVKGAAYFLYGGGGTNIIAEIRTFKTDASGALTQLVDVVASGGFGAKDLQVSPDGSTLVVRAACA